MPGNSWQRSLTLGVLGAALWALWAYYANRPHGAAPALRAALTQAAVAFVITFFMTASAEFFVRFGKHPALRFAIALSATFGIIIPATWAVHAVSGTPEILKTLSPAWIVGVAFCAAYVAALLRSEVGSGEAQRAERH